MPRATPIFALALLASVGCHTSSRRLVRETPAVMLWAWERPEDLRFLDSQQTGVAFLAETIEIRADGHLRVTPRLNALQLPRDSAAEAVVRIEARPQHAAADPFAVALALEHVAEQPGVRVLQVDFDARLSERAFYERVLERTKQLIAIPLSVTALVSWCSGDRWLDDQPFAEAVPMLFRMGRVELRDAEFKSPVCQSAVGLSTDEAWPIHRPAQIRRVYLFNPHAWTPARYRDAIRRLKAWQ